MNDQNPAANSLTGTEPAVLDPEFTVDEPLAGPTAHERLRAFEDEHIGKDAVRIHGRIERGYGSKFKALPPEKHAHYTALERLVEAEQHLTEANAKLSAAQGAHAEAVAAVDRATEAANSEPAEADADRVE